MNWVSPFDSIFDVAVIGSGYTGFAAAMACGRLGMSVLLTGRDGALAWESGRTFMPETGESEAELWRHWTAELAARGGLRNGLTDGAIAEIVATDMLHSQRDAITPLYYVQPVAVQVEGSRLVCVGMATKDGVKPLTARSWIDATSTGELTRLLSPDAMKAQRPPSRRRLHMYLQHQAFHALRDLPDLPPPTPATSLQLHHSTWENEKRLTLTTGSPEEDLRALIRPALRLLRDALPEALKNAPMSHCSIRPDCSYDAGDATALDLPANVICATAGLMAAKIGSAASRFDAGLMAAEAVRACPPADVQTPAEHAPAFVPAERVKTRVVVAGAGTGGAIAAIAAARQGVETICTDLMPFPGGLGTGGGVNGYCKGAKGGLFEDADRRAREIRSELSPTGGVGGWHHESKKIALEDMFGETGVQFLHEGLVFDVSCNKGSITDVWLALPDRCVRIQAASVVDATADADLVRQAGLKTQGGRPGDGGVLSFSQVAGRMTVNRDNLYVGMVNYDAGKVDPTDAPDLSRGRTEGVRQFLRDRFTALERPCFIAPVIGLRQSKHIHSDRDLTLADLIEHRTFEDTIGPTLAFLDTHAVDFEFEADDAWFWLWVCKNFRGELWSHLPYRMLLPVGLDNVWVGCRAAGMSTEAAYSTRMERDIQRLGEAAGTAAALAAARGLDSRHINIADLQRLLRDTGSIDKDESRPDARTGQERLDAGLNDLMTGAASGDLWFVHRNQDACESAVLDCLAASNAQVSWQAAALLAMWRDSRAEPRLLDALSRREIGPEPPESARGAFGQRVVIPNWLLAVILLRRCGTTACIPPLKDLADTAGLPLNVRTAVALTVEQLALHGGDLPHNTLAEILDLLVRDDPPDRVCRPSRSIDLLLRGEPQLRLGNDIGSDTREDHGWQLDLTVAKARAALGSSVVELVQAGQQDRRATVRRPFSVLSGDHASNAIG